MARKKKTPDDRWIVTTQKELAELFGVPFSTIRRWRDEGLPGENGHYDLRKILPWWTARFEGPHDSDDEARLKKARADIAEENLRAMRAESMPVTEHKEYVVRLCAEFRETLLGTVSSLSHSTANRSARKNYETIKKEYQELLWAFAPDGEEPRPKKKSKRKKPSKKRGK